MRQEVQTFSSVLCSNQHQFLDRVGFCQPITCCGTNNSTVQFSFSWYLFSTISGYLVHKFTAVASSSTSNCFGCDWASFSSHVACHAYLHPCESSWTLRLHGLDVARPVSSDHKAPAHCITDNLQTRRRQSHVYLQGVCYASLLHRKWEKDIVVLIECFVHEACEAFVFPDTCYTHSSTNTIHNHLWNMFTLK